MPSSKGLRSRVSKVVTHFYRVNNFAKQKIHYDYLIGCRFVVIGLQIKTKNIQVLQICYQILFGVIGLQE